MSTRKRTQYRTWQSKTPVYLDHHMISFQIYANPSQAFNPGNLNTGLTRYMTMPILGSIVPRLMSLVMWPARYGAYTELYAGLSPDLTIEKHVGAFIWPWGHVGYLRPDIEDSLRSQEEGGSGKAAQVLTWCDREVKNFT